MESPPFLPHDASRTRQPPIPVLPASAPAFVVSTQESRDNEHLKLLALFHYIGGAMVMLFSSFAIIHFVIGITVITHPHAFDPPTTQPGVPDFPAQWMGWMFAGIGGAVVSLGSLTLYSGRCISRRRHRVYSFGVAIFLTLWMPIGTVLGVFTILVLQRESVKVLYNATA